MNINRDIKITLNKEEQEAVRKVNAIVAEFVDKNLCKQIPCYNCPFAIFCSIPENTNNFEETLNDIANME